MSRIEMTDTMLDCFIKLSNGNPGAVTALMKLSEKAGTIDPDSAWGSLSPLMSLDTLGLYGPDIWILWKDVCHQDEVTTLGLLRANQMGFVSDGEIKSALADQGKNLDLEGLLTQVKERLPRFGQTVGHA